MKQHIILELGRKQRWALARFAQGLSPRELEAYATVEGEAGLLQSALWELTAGDAFLDIQEQDVS